MTVEVLDLNFQGRPQCVAAFLVTHPDANLLIECGPASCRSQLLQQLAQRGLAPSDISALLLTHIHLDHAGDAGWWTQQGVQVWVHPVGLPHLCDPSKLLASAVRIYGEHMDRLWGEVRPCLPERIRPWPLNQSQSWGSLPVIGWDSPGHARHHLAFQLQDQLFCGDVAGCCLPGSQVLAVPAPPPEFDRETWLTTIAHLRTLEVERLWLTHFGGHSQPQAHWETLAQAVEEVTEFVGQRQGLEREQVLAQYLQWQAGLVENEALLDRYQQANPLFMSVDGILRYWKKRSA